MSQFIKDIKEKKYQNIHNLQVKTRCKKYNVSLIPASLSILIIMKFIKANKKVF